MIIRKYKESLFCLLSIFIFLIIGCSVFQPNNQKQTDTISNYSITFTPSISYQFTCVTNNNPRETARVIKIIDGDSILVDLNGQNYEVRYIGINAPEFYGLNDVSAQNATAINRELVFGKTITMVRDIRELDKYGRLLRFVFTDDYFVNAELVRRGVAEIYDYTPDISCQKYFRSILK